MRRLLPISLLVLLLVALAAGCGGTSGPRAVPPGAVAVVGSAAITKAQYDSVVDQIKQSFKAQKVPFPKEGSQDFKSQVRDRAVQSIVQREEVEQRAQDLDIKVSQAEIAARLKQYKKQYFGNSDKVYRQQLKAAGYTEQDFLDQIRVQLESEKIYDQVTKDVKVSDSDVQKYYNAHKSQYAKPETRDVRHILVSSKTLADSLYAQLKKGASFATLAKKYSTDKGSAAKGGQLCVAHGTSTDATCFQTVPEFDKAAFSLKTNEISKPVHSQYGWHIIQPTSAIHAASVQPLSQVRETIRQQLLQQQKTSVMNKWVNDMKKDFCRGKIGYQDGFQPLTDPCVAATVSVSTAAGTTSS
jgi:parvulin-like peptidyl-prolyl isomerase